MCYTHLHLARMYLNICFYLCFLVAKDVNIFFDELEGVNSPSKDDDSLLHHGNLTSTSDDASRLEVVGEVRQKIIKIMFTIKRK